MIPWTAVTVALTFFAIGFTWGCLYGIALGRKWEAEESRYPPYPDWSKYPADAEDAEDA